MNYFVDEEIKLRLGLYGNGEHGADNFCEGPDLAGITQCIRMVSIMNIHTRILSAKQTILIL